MTIGRFEAISVESREVAVVAMVSKERIVEVAVEKAVAATVSAEVVVAEEAVVVGSDGFNATRRYQIQNPRFILLHESRRGRGIRPYYS
jgi:hypothetical protein